MISQASVLNKIHQINDIDRNKFSIEALVNLIKMIDMSYAGLIIALDDYDNSDKEAVSMLAWLVVGNFNRLRVLLSKISGIKKNESWFQLFSRKLKQIEDIRHIIEHYDEKLDKLISETKPLLGHISWLVYEGEKKIFIKLGVPGTLRLFKGLGMVNPAGKHIRLKIDHVTYYLGDNQVDLSDLYYAMQDFTHGLENYIQNKYFQEPAP